MKPQYVLIPQNGDERTSHVTYEHISHKRYLYTVL